MDDFVKYRNSVVTKIDIQLSTFGLACQCDYVVCNRFFGAFPKWNINEECLGLVPHGGRIFLNCVDSGYGVYRDILHRVFSAHPEKKYVFYIMIEPEDGILDILRDICRYSCGFYVNCNVVDDPRVHNMPIGIRDGGEVLDFHRGFSQKMLLNAHEKWIGTRGNSALVSTSDNRRDILCLLCFSYTHQERQRAYNMLTNKPFITDLNKDSNKYGSAQSRLLGKVPVEYNYEMTARAIYAISPRGCGEATHRFFEAIYLDCIPVVKRTNTVFDRLYALYPCLVVDDWNQVTEELLTTNRVELQGKIVAFKERFPGWFQDPTTIREMMDLL
jgi:hypothetical protein